MDIGVGSRSPTAALPGDSVQRDLRGLFSGWQMARLRFGRTRCTRGLRTALAGRSGKQQISVGGGRMPILSPNGRELFYLNADEQISVVDYKIIGGSLVVSKPRIWS